MILKEQEICEKYLGVSFKFGGVSIEDGFDCWGLIVNIYVDLGFGELYGTKLHSSYKTNWYLNGQNYFIENYHHQFIEVKQPRLFDIVLFNLHGVVGDHVGVILSNNKFIQCTKPSGVNISKLKLWKPKIVGFYRFKNDPS